MKLDLWLLAALYFGGAVDATISSNHTQALLGSGTIKLGDWQDAYDRASQFVSSLSTTEKLSIITGGSAGNFSGVNTLDSSTNPINYYFVTAWPAGLSMSMTWGKDAVKEQGKALGAEFKGKGVNIAFAPTVQPLGRSAWAGRTGEAYGPDSFLASIMGGAMVEGMTLSGVTPSAKHYILNEQETNRQGSTSGGGGGEMGGVAGGNTTEGGPGGNEPPSMQRRQNPGNATTTTSSSSEAYNAVVEDKAFHETYLAPFYDTVKARIGGAMCSMQRINGSYGCENQDTLGRYLKVELGFPGFVHPDAGAQHTSLDSANAGLDMGASSYWSNSTLIERIANGTFTEARLDDMATRILMGYFRYNQENYPTHAGYTDDVDIRKNHGDLARTHAANSIALLKNTKNALPLRNRRSVSIFGIHAAPRYVGPNTALSVMSGVGPTMDGHMAQVGGSAMMSTAFLVTPVQAFSERAMEDGFMLRWWLNDTVVTSQSGMTIGDGAGTELVETTAGVTAGSDACVVFINAYSSEGGDRSELANANQDNLVNTVADNCNNTIVVVKTNGPRLLGQWATHENVTGILYGGPLGQSSSHAINDILFGDVNPSGKLKNVTPRYEFGFGLSYTTFEYGKSLEISPDTEKLTNEYAGGALAVGGCEDLWDIVAEVSTDLKNSGDMACAEVAQLYVEFPAAADEPVRQLRGFHKVMIEPGSTKKASFQLRRRDLSIWDVEAQEWAIVRGDYTFHVGASSRDLRVSGTMTV